MPRPTPLSRRAALALAPAALLALTAACDADPDASSDPVRRDPDEGLLAAVAAATRSLRDRVELVRVDAEGGRGAALGALSSCLTAHLAELAPDEDPAATAPTPSVPATAELPATGTPSPTSSPAPVVPATFTAVLAEARAHVTVLTDAASRAESGAFARLLACAAGGVQQHLVPLGRTRPTETVTERP